jgi:hypothetical protein
MERAIQHTTDHSVPALTPGIFPTYQRADGDIRCSQAIVMVRERSRKSDEVVGEVWTNGSLVEGP